MRILAFSSTITLLFMFHSLPVQATVWFRHSMCVSKRGCRTVNITKPEHPHEVKRAYQWFVRTEDGVTEREALIMAQYEVVQKRIDRDYHLGKPKVIAETGEEWTVRLPGKFSYTKGHANMYVVCINKTDGRITCSKTEEKNVP